MKELPIDTIICGDAVSTLKTFPDKSIDLIITSPPYNLKNSTGNGMKPHKKGRWSHAALINGYDNYSDNIPHEIYVEWQRSVLKQCMRILKDDGAIFYNHKWRVQNGLIQDRQDIVSGFPVRQIIIWQKNGGINFNDSFFLPTYEVIYMIAKKEFRLIRKANRAGDVWYIPRETNNAHPAPFPVELPKRIIQSTNAQIVLDPFVGSGSTAVAAKQLGRHYIGIDLSEEYCQMAEDRLDTPFCFTGDCRKELDQLLAEPTITQHELEQSLGLK